MGRGNFTKTEMETLLRNPYVADVNEKSISYSTEFKFLFMNEYIKGKRPTQIFRDAGFDIGILGSKRIERAWCCRSPSAGGGCHAHEETPGGSA